MVNYPNPIDKTAGKTGYDIMLHATDDPPRLKRDLDSEGCVVIDNHEILELEKEVQLGLTPFIIYDELKPEYLKANYDQPLQNAFQSWLKAWQGKDIDTYIGSYAKEFSYNGMNIKQYREYKNSLNQRYSAINIEAKNVRYFNHPKYSVVYFTQDYSSELKGGGKGFKSVGTKILYFVKDQGQYKIANESYSNLREE
jgi:murein L,D-transpeptidase YafK